MRLPASPISIDIESSDDELTLLDTIEATDFDLGTNGQDHDSLTAPLISYDALNSKRFEGITEYTQYSVLGRLYGDRGILEEPNDPRLYLNTNAPFSALVCGVQGSGKSHSVSVLLEGMLIPNLSSIGTLKKPLAGLVFYYGEGGNASRPCEAAYLAQAAEASKHIEAPNVVVYVSPTALNTMKAVYAPLGSRITVKRLKFSEQELDALSFRSLMAVNSSANIPLYMQIVLSILRDLGETFTYQAFRVRLKQEEQNFSEAQIGPLKQRLSLLESFISSSGDERARFTEGQLTIIDLSDPFIDPNLAASLFEIMTRLFVRADLETGKVLLVDEAHKYLTPGSLASGQTNGLTKTLLRLIREQRHLGLRVVISTQEPTVVPSVLIDLCSITILHRFSSPHWWTHITGHISADFSNKDAFDTIVKLKNGQAIVLAPTGLGYFKNGNMDSEEKTVNQFGRRYLLIRSRKRVTADGGASVLVLH